MLGPVLVGLLRLALIAIGGWVLAAQQAPAALLFVLVSAAMVVYGLGTAAVIYRARWGRR
jgi:hypothetical protein